MSIIYITYQFGYFFTLITSRLATGYHAVIIRKITLIRSNLVQMPRCIIIANFHYLQNQYKLPSWHLIVWKETSLQYQQAYELPLSHVSQFLPLSSFFLWLSIILQFTLLQSVCLIPPCFCCSSVAQVCSVLLPCYPT